MNLKDKGNSAPIIEKSTGKRVSQKQLIKKLVAPSKQKIKVHLTGFSGTLLFYRTSPYDLVLEQLSPGLRKPKPSYKPQSEITRLHNGDTIDLEVTREIVIS